MTHTFSWNIQKPRTQAKKTMLVLFEDCNGNGWLCELKSMELKMTMWTCVSRSSIILWHSGSTDVTIPESVACLLKSAPSGQTNSTIFCYFLPHFLPYVQGLYCGTAWLARHPRCYYSHGPSYWHTFASFISPWHLPSVSNTSLRAVWWPEFMGAFHGT